MIVVKKAFWKMTVFRAIFEVNSSIGKLWDLLGHYDKKDMVFLKKMNKIWAVTLTNVL